ncbi:3-hydroxyisobutyrate dehydrogenase-like beta-hydroxyacid dehydrogenase [Thermocatellispora tengchongensis]|uniref:3-hydroxyisobutyrate dehydrogenase-like beta-hydroxyacid dehydrogenase n=1 Tax=Thermocatellispora tengchongensis TaxID=1073253 RepID=A0A840PVM2_9ACTN|nr:NAD(P)-binding domain-containing protein [Thermocatellispora tengchongensis]MBB5139935.1 3-hydroxyisobutyrate dehydrogenase-like beta-hydroxyacid dehydrogenase [Thermocatellispora tengchongensis]
MTTTPVTVLGLGPMGQALAGAFLRAGHPVTVWNRTPAKAEPLVEQGARLAASVADAVAASPLTVICVIDYDAVETIVTHAADALAGRTLVNLTADTPARARAMAEWAAANGIDYLDGAIMTPTVTIGGPDAVLLYSGPAEVYERHRATLAALGGSATHLGADPGRAAAHDVALLDLFWTSMAGLMHAFALAREEGISAADLAPFAKGIGDLIPALLDELAAEVDRGEYPGDTSTIESAAAGMDHIIHTATGHGLDTTVLIAARAIAQRAIADGHAKDGFTRLTETMKGAPATR